MTFQECLSGLLGFAKELPFVKPWLEDQVSTQNDQEQGSANLLIAENLSDPAD